MITTYGMGRGSICTQGFGHFGKDTGFFTREAMKAYTVYAHISRRQTLSLVLLINVLQTRTAFFDIYSKIRVHLSNKYEIWSQIGFKRIETTLLKAKVGRKKLLKMLEAIRFWD